MENQQVTPTQETYEPKQPAEAGFSCNMFLTNDLMGRIQFTFRGATSGDWGATLEDVDRFAHYMREKGWKFDGEKPQAAAPVPSAPVRIAIEEGNKPLAQTTAKAELEVPPPPAGKEWIVFAASAVKVLPQPDNKVTIEFYGDGQKYPGVKVNKWKVENANGLMKYVTSEDMGKAAEYKLQCQVYYTEGAEGKTAEGKIFHWKDVSHVRPLPF